MWARETGYRAEVWCSSRSRRAGSAPVFVGIGPSDQVTAYLSGVEYDEVTNLGWFNSSVDLVPHEGGAPAASPGQQTFWVAQQEGSGSQSVQWNVTSGSWTAVVMNADGSAPVSVGLRLGARLGFLLPLGIGLTVAGVVFLAVGILLVVLGARRPHSPLQPGYGDRPAYGPVPPPYGGPQPPYGQQPPPYAQYTAPPYQPPVGRPPEGQAPAGELPAVEPAAQPAPGESPGTPPLS